jgi:hypothetical protein
VSKVGVAAPPQRPRAAHSVAVRLRPHHAQGEVAVQEAPARCVGKKAALGRRRLRRTAPCIEKKAATPLGDAGE